MRFQHHADVFAHRATVGAGLASQIVVEGSGQVQLDIAVAFGAAAWSWGQRQAQGGLFIGANAGEWIARRRAAPRHQHNGQPSLPGLEVPDPWSFAPRGVQFEAGNPFRVSS